VWQQIKLSFFEGEGWGDAGVGVARRRHFIFPPSVEKEVGLGGGGERIFPRYLSMQNDPSNYHQIILFSKPVWNQIPPS